MFPLENDVPCTPDGYAGGENQLKLRGSQTEVLVNSVIINSGPQPGEQIQTKIHTAFSLRLIDVIHQCPKPLVSINPHNVKDGTKAQ